MAQAIEPGSEPVDEAVFLPSLPTKRRLTESVSLTCILWPSQNAPPPAVAENVLVTQQKGPPANSTCNNQAEFTAFFRDLSLRCLFTELVIEQGKNGTAKCMSAEEADGFSSLIVLYVL